MLFIPRIDTRKRLLACSNLPQQSGIVKLMPIMVFTQMFWCIQLIIFFFLPCPLAPGEPNCHIRAWASAAIFCIQLGLFWKCCCLWKSLRLRLHFCGRLAVFISVTIRLSRCKNGNSAHLTHWTQATLSLHSHTTGESLLSGPCFILKACTAY